MSYATGSGDYNALMAAVLAFAIADGWTTFGGTWPISKGNVRGVAWSTRTIAATDYLSGSALPITERIIEIAIGTSLANATANAAITTNCVQVRGMNFSISEWNIYSDPANFNYIHVVTRSSNGYDADVYQHFSFGEIDKGGMTYGSVAYAAASGRRPYVAVLPSVATNQAQSYDWNGGINNNFPSHFSGRVPIPTNYDRLVAGTNNLVYIINPTTSPVPGGGGWPVVDTVANQGSVLDTMAGGQISLVNVGTAALAATNFSCGLNFMVATASSQPYSGGISLSPMPFIILNGTGSTAIAMFLGMFPGVRACSLKTFFGGDEVTYSTETWKLAPLIKKTDFSLMQQSSVVSSGESGYAYKKVP